MALRPALSVWLTGLCLLALEGSVSLAWSQDAETPNQGASGSPLRAIALAP